MTRAELQQMRKDFGNTCVYVKDCSWGGLALNRKARDDMTERCQDEVKKCLAETRAILERCSRMLGQVEPRREAAPRLTCDDVEGIVCKYFKVDRESLRSKSRRKAVWYPRAVAIYLCRVHTNESLESIGRAFSRHHATVVYDYERIKQDIRTNEKVRKEVEFLSKQIEGHIFFAQEKA